MSKFFLISAKICQRRCSCSCTWNIFLGRQACVQFLSGGLFVIGYFFLFS